MAIIVFILTLVFTALLLLLPNFRHMISDEIKNTIEVIKLTFPILAASAAVLTWAYLSGSKRLGAIDLFSSEMSVICQSCLITDFAKLSVLKATQMLPPAVGPLRETNLDGEKFSIEEHYTPVFDNYISELKPLEYDIINRVTLFYAYRKMMMDSLRRLYEATTPDNRQKYMKDMIYMQFLMYESGRLACEKLIECPQNRAESRICFFCSELETFHFLSKYYPIDDFRGARLHQRAREYIASVDGLLNEVKSRYEQRPQWKSASILARQLQQVFRRDELERLANEVCSIPGSHSTKRAGN
jgi:hypothetical protein